VLGHSCGRCIHGGTIAKKDIEQACVEELVNLWKKQKNIHQTYCVIEKQGKDGPCTHHLHAYLHYSVAVQIESVKKIIKKIVSKYHSPDKDDSKFAVMLKTNTCYTYKDYLGKYEDSDKITGDDFDVAAFTADMPDEEMHAALQAACPTRIISALWANHEAKWREFSPDDLSVNGCHRYLTHRFFVAKDLDPVSDPRKLEQLIGGIFRYVHVIVNPVWGGRKRLCFILSVIVHF